MPAQNASDERPQRGAQHNRYPERGHRGRIGRRRGWCQGVRLGAISIVHVHGWLASRVRRQQSMGDGRGQTEGWRDRKVAQPGIVPLVSGDIPALDTEAQNASLSRDLEAAAARVLRSGRFILGEEVAAFEREVAVLLGVRHAVGVSSGSDALLALLMSVGVGPGDEVVTTPYSFFATAEAIVRLGARPVFVDVDPSTLNIDPHLAAAGLGPRTRATLIVHLFGRIAQSLRLVEACAGAGVPMIEDAAQAIGAWTTEGRDDSQRRSCGTLGVGAAVSFFPTKNLGGFGDGGMVLTNDERVADRIRLLRNHGAHRKLQHDIVGGNFRLDELQAALLRVKLPYLDRWAAERRRVAMRYRERLADLPIRLPPWDDGCVWNQFVIGVPAGLRSSLIDHLGRRGIAARVYYPTPLHLQPALSYLGHRLGDFPHAEQAARESLALPIYPELTDGQASVVAGAVADFFG
jgi:dTDP-4-amino-4,6-dideoxygalactose transaminase